MVDIHAHILPLVDDGPSSIEEALDLARQAVEEGITDLIATPHHRHPRFDTSGLDVKQSVCQLNAFLQQQGIPLQVHPGQEVRISGELHENLRAGSTHTLAGSRYVLVEFPSSAVPSYASQSFGHLLSAGYVPVIAHPERNRAILENPDILFEFVSNGAISQLTCASVAGKYGKDVQRFSIALLEKGLAHLVASDAHDAQRRPPCFRECRLVLERMVDHSLFIEIYANAENILCDTSIPSKMPNRIKKNWRGRWV